MKKEKMRFLFCTHVYPPEGGGIAAFSRDIVGLLKRMGYEVRIFKDNNKNGLDADEFHLLENQTQFQWGTHHPHQNGKEEDKNPPHFLDILQDGPSKIINCRGNLIHKAPKRVSRSNDDKRQRIQALK